MCLHCFNFEQISVSLGYYAAAGYIRSWKKLIDVRQLQKKKVADKIRQEFYKSREALQLQGNNEKLITILLNNSRIQRLTKREKANLQGWKTSVKMLQKEYWRHMLTIADLIEKNFSDNPWVREYVANCKRDEWKAQKAGLLSPILLPEHVDSCKRRGGCCAHGCGCCRRHRTRTSYEGKVYSHCTVFCTCCSIRRGFVDPWEDSVEDFDKIVEIDPRDGTKNQDEDGLGSGTTYVNDERRD